MNTYILRLTIAIFCFFFASGMEAKDIIFSNILAEHSNTQRSAISIYQSADKKIWFGNTTLNLYTHTGIQSYRISDYLPNIEDSYIHSICGDRANNLYFLAEHKLVKFDTKQEEFVDTQITTSAIFVYDNKLYYSQDNSLFVVDKDSTSKVFSLDPGTVITTIQIDPTAILAGANNGVYLYKGNQLRKVIDSPDVSALLMTKDQVLWIGSSTDGLTRMDLNHDIESRFTEQNTRLINNQVRCITEGNNNTIWIGTYKGITLFDHSGSVLETITHDNKPWSLSHYSVYSICKDNNNGMWIGTYFGGINYMNPKMQGNIYPTNQMMREEASQGFIFGRIAEDNNGNIYVGTENGGIKMLDSKSNSAIKLDVKNSISMPHTVKDICFDSTYNRLIIGSFREGIFTYDISSKSLTRIVDKSISEDQYATVKRIIEFKNGYIILGEKNVFVLNKSDLSLSVLDKHAPFANKQGILQEIYIDRKQNLWLSSSKQGIFTYNFITGKTVQVPIINDAARNTKIQSICEDGNGNLYFVTNNKGIICLSNDHNQLIEYNALNSNLVSNHYFQGIATPSGKLIFSFMNGVTCFDPQNRSMRHTYFDKQYPFKVENATCGLFVSKTNQIIIGGIKALMIFDETKLLDEPNDYNLWISKIAINNNAISYKDQKRLYDTQNNIVLTHDQNSIQIGFSSTNYSEKKTIYQYKLEGLEQNWNQAQSNLITYVSLPSGEFNLRIREMSYPGKILSIPIIIKPAFYASPFAYGCYALLTLLLIATVLRFYKKEAELKASLSFEHKDKLRMKEATEAKNAFFTSVSHELRTPLTLLKSHIEYICDNFELSASLRKRLHKINTHTEDMQTIVAELVDVHQQGQDLMKLQLDKQDMNRFVAETAEKYNEYAEKKNISFQTYFNDSVLDVWFDKEQMKKVVNNLISNAFKFTPSFGYITLKVSKKHSSVEIEVCNSGPGIPENELPYIFNRYYRAENLASQTQGSGIGLSVAKAIVTLHHGTITANSTPNESTRFVVSIPLFPATTDSIMDSTLKSDVLDSRNLTIEESALSQIQKDRSTILIIEDNEELLSILVDSFAPFFNIMQSTNGIDAYRQICENKPDLIISDSMIPELSGTELCKKLKLNPQYQDIPFIFLTAKTSSEQILDGYIAGANDYIIKPFNMQTLLLKCKNMLAHNGTKKQCSSFEDKKAQDLYSGATNKTDKEFLKQSQQIIEAHIAEKDFNVDNWSEEIGVSRSKLQYKIKALTGLTPNDYILKLKLEKARHLLENAPDMNINEIAWNCGFSGGSYFGKCFKAFYNTTPGELRKQINNKQS